MSNIEIEYKYRTSKEIIEAISPLSNFSIIEIIIIVVSISFVIGVILYIAPWLQKNSLNRKKEAEKKKKKLSLQQILVTKEIEQEIENEIKQEQEEKLKAKLQ